MARDIARVLGAPSKGDGYLHGNGYVVTWAIGHLVALAQPHEIHRSGGSGGAICFRCCPSEWPLVVYEKTKDQFEVVRRILNSPEVARVVCATDAGREGELIFRYIYEAARCAKPVQPVVDLLADAGCHPQWLRRSCGQGRDTIRWPMPRGAAAGRIGWWA